MVRFQLLDAQVTLAAFHFFFFFFLLDHTPSDSVGLAGKTVQLLGYLQVCAL
jgi:hypothetical protein